MEKKIERFEDLQVWKESMLFSSSGFRSPVSVSWLFIKDQLRELQIC